MLEYTHIYLPTKMTNRREETNLPYKIILIYECRGNERNRKSPLEYHSNNYSRQDSQINFKLFGKS